jgi:hypothetical protein
MRGEYMSRLAAASKAGDLLRSAADRLDIQDPDESQADLVARLRGAAILAHAAGLELAAVSGFVDALVAAELHTDMGGVS